MLYIRYETNVPGPSGVGKTHIALALGLAACQKGLGVRFATASYLVHELIVARDEKRLLRLQAQFARVTLLIIDELGYEREDLIFDPLHYLPLIERKIGALDQAAPLAGWDLPEAFATLRRLMEARMGKAGKREYVQVLRLLESFRLAEVEAAIGDALKLGAIGFDAVKHLVLCRIERRPPRLDLDVYPYLPKARVATTSARSYMSLLPGAGT